MVTLYFIMVILKERMPLDLHVCLIHVMTLYPCRTQMCVTFPPVPWFSQKGNAVVWAGKEMLCILARL